MEVTKREEHISFLDHLRGIAIILVFAFHALGASYGTDHLNWHGWLRDFHAPPTFLLLLPATLGWIGVPIFFVVSGFCIHLSHERSQGKSFKVFFARRFFRIYPPYFVALLFFAFILPESPAARVSLNSLHGLAQLTSHLFLIHNFSHKSFFRINPSFWSIAVEAQLYLLYPLLLLFVRRLGWKGALWLAGAIEILLRAISGWHDPMPQWFTSSPFAFWFSWSIGAMLANDFLKGSPLALRACPLWLWPSVTLLCYLIKPLSEFCFVSAALFTANIIAYLLSTPGTRILSTGKVCASLFMRHVRWTGIISYSVYLLHQPLLGLVPKLFEKFAPSHQIHPLVIFASCWLVWPIVLFLSYWFYHFVEKPSIQLGKSFIRSQLRDRPQRD